MDFLGESRGGGWVTAQLARVQVGLAARGQSAIWHAAGGILRYVCWMMDRVGYFDFLGQRISFNTNTEQEWQYRLGRALRAFHVYSAFWRLKGQLLPRLRILEAAVAPALAWGAGTRPWTTTQLCQAGRLQLKNGAQAPSCVACCGRGRAVARSFCEVPDCA